MPLCRTFGSRARRSAFSRIEFSEISGGFAVLERVAGDCVVVWVVFPDTPFARAFLNASRTPGERASRLVMTVSIHCASSSFSPATLTASERCSMPLSTIWVVQSGLDDGSDDVVWTIGGLAFLWACMQQDVCGVGVRVKQFPIKGLGADHRYRGSIGSPSLTLKHARPAFEKRWKGLC